MTTVALIDESELQELRRHLGAYHRRQFPRGAAGDEAILHHFEVVR